MKRTTQKIPKHAVRDNARLQLVSTPTDRRNPKIRDKIENDLKFIERKIVMSMIVDDDFCQWAVDNLDFRLLESPELKMIAGWVTEYFRDFGQRAPRRDIETIYTEQLKAGLDRERAEFVEMILESLSNEYEQVDLNIQYLKHLTDRWRQRQELDQRMDEAKALLANNEIEDAIEILKFEPRTSDNDLRKYIIGFDELEKMEIEQPKLFLSPWLRQGDTNIVYGAKGVGKSLFIMHLIWIMSCENYQEEECEINDWQVKNPIGTLYLDGELGAYDVRDRFQAYKWMGDPIPDKQIRTIITPEYMRETGKEFNLSLRAVQKQILKFFEYNPEYKILVMDSLSTLFNIENESDNSEYHNKVQPFLVELRGHGITQIILDHAGKNGELRGASAKGTIAANIIRLTDHPNKVSGQAWFNISFKDKQRMAGTENKPFSLKYTYDKTDRETTWEHLPAGSGSKSAGEPTKKAEIINLISQGCKYTEIADRLGLQAISYITKVKQWARKQNFMLSNGTLTAEGRKFCREHLGGVEEENFS